MRRKKVTIEFDVTNDTADTVNIGITVPDPMQRFNSDKVTWGGFSGTTESLHYKLDELEDVPVAKYKVGDRLTTSRTAFSMPVSIEIIAVDTIHKEYVYKLLNTDVGKYLIISFSYLEDTFMGAVDMKLKA